MLVAYPSFDQFLCNDVTICSALFKIYNFLYESKNSVKYSVTDMIVLSQHLNQVYICLTGEGFNV